MVPPVDCKQQPIAIACAAPEALWPWAAVKAASVTASAALFAVVTNADAATATTASLLHIIDK